MGLFDIKQKKKKVLKKNMSWTQAKAKFPKLSPFKDADKDGVSNWLDCKPFDRKRQDDKEWGETVPEKSIKHRILERRASKKGKNYFEGDEEEYEKEKYDLA